MNSEIQHYYPNAKRNANIPLSNTANTNHQYHPIAIPVKLKTPRTYLRQHPNSKNPPKPLQNHLKPTYQRTSSVASVNAHVPQKKNPFGEARRNVRVWGLRASFRWLVAYAPRSVDDGIWRGGGWDRHLDEGDLLVWSWEYGCTKYSIEV